LKKFWFWFDDIMVTYLNVITLAIAGIMLQFVILPAHLADPFKPNLLISCVVYLGFNGRLRSGALVSFLMGLLQDSLSGIYFGLDAFSYLLLFLLYNETANRLYTGSRTLMVLGTFIATIINAGIQFVLLLIFSELGDGSGSFLSGVIPQGAVNALASALIFSLLPSVKQEETA
jgi:rod shape-determining protein MreD